jgi:acetylornithine deacetylase/succinyl-diaminopimelate desuccinylase-like protein
MKILDGEVSPARRSSTRGAPNLIARSAEGAPIILLNHTDVVTSDPAAGRRRPSAAPSSTA